MNLIDAVQVILVESQMLGTVTLTRDSQRKSQDQQPQLHPELTRNENGQNQKL